MDPDPEDDDDFDVEAEFLRELAMLGPAEHSISAEVAADAEVSNEPGNNKSTGAAGGIRRGVISLSDSDDDDGDSRDESDTGDPASLSAWQQHMARKDAQLLTLEQELQQDSMRSAHASRPDIAHASPHAGQLFAHSEEKNSAEVDIAVGSDPTADATASRAEPESGTSSVMESSVQTAMRGIQELLRKAASAQVHGGTADGPEAHAVSTANDDLKDSAVDLSTTAPSLAPAPAPAPSPAPSPDAAPGASDPGSEGYSESGLERQALFDAYRRDEEQRAVERERFRRAERERVEREAAEAESRVREEEAVRAKRHAARQAALEAEAEAAREQRQTEAAAAAAEELLLVEERRAMEERKARMAADAATRAAQLQELMREVHEGMVAQARLRFAARRIARAWLAYRSGPVRQQRVECITGLQAMYRARVARQQYRQLAARQAVMRRLEAAASKGQLEAVKEVLEMAKGVGLASEVQARVTAMEGQAKEAAQKLTSAATGGTFSVYRAALDVASRFSHLAGLVKESEVAFAGRRAEAECSMQAAVEGRSLPEVAQALQVAALLGTDAAVLAASLASARQRDTTATAALRATAAAARGPLFDLAAFQSAVERGLSLGLRGDVAAARHIVERRKAAVALDFKRRAAEAGAEEVQAMVSEAQTLGMDIEAGWLQKQLAHKQGELAAALQQAASAGNSAVFDRLMGQVEHLGLDNAALAEAQGALDSTRGCVLAALRERAEAGTLAEYRGARMVAVRAGCVAEAESHHRVLEQRRLAAAAALSEALQEHWLAGHQAQQQQQKGGGDLSCFQAVSEALQASLERGWAKPAVKGQHESSTGSSSKKDSGRGNNQLAASPAALPEEVSSALKRGADASGGKPAPAAAQASVAAAVIWPLLVACTELGLSFNAGLAMSVALLSCKVLAAQDAITVTLVTLARDYWGRPDLPDWQAVSPSPDAASSAKDTMATLGLNHLRQRRDCGALESPAEALEGAWAWPGRAPGSALGELYRRLCAGEQAGGGGGAEGGVEQKQWAAGEAAAPLPAEAVRRLPAVPQRPPRRAGPPGGGQPLSRALIVSLAAHDGGGTSSLVRLDLGLERLNSLIGLDEACQGLQVLLANSNHLTSIEGLGALCSLRELSLKDNYLAGAAGGVGGGAGAGGMGGRAPSPWLGGLPCSLNKLHLDSNGLLALPVLPAPLPQLCTLSFSHNAISSLDQETPGPAPAAGLLKSLRCYLPWLAPRLTTLDLCGNRLSGSLASLGALSCLTHLDVSHNCLTSLGGLQLCGALTVLDARSNQIAAPCLLPWPGPPSRQQQQQQPYQMLRRLHLDQNSLTCLEDLPPLPALVELNMQDNQISRLCSLHATPSLTSLDLSFNALDDLDSLQSLTPLLALRRLRMSDNPLAPAAQPPRQQQQRQQGGATSAEDGMRERYVRAVARAAPWLSELDGDAVAPAAAAARATAAAAGSHLVAAAVMRALAAGTVMCLPRGSAAVEAAVLASSSSSITEGTASAVAAAPAASAAAAVAVDSSNSPLSPSSSVHPVVIQQALLLSSLASTALGGGALPGARVPVAMLSGASGALRQGWLLAAERTWAAFAPVSTAAQHAVDAAAAAAQLPLLRQGTAELGPGPAASYAEVLLGALPNAVSPVAASALAPLLLLLDRRPLRGFAKLSSRLAAMQSLQLGGSATPLVPDRSAPSPRKLQSALGHAPGSWTGCSREDLLLEHEEAGFEMRRLQVEQTSRDVATAAGIENGDGPAGLQQEAEGDGAFEARPSYYAGLLDAAAAAACTLQATWRAREARRIATTLRSDHHRCLMTAAAVKIQAAWRGCAVRSSSDLEARRAAARRRREAAESAERGRREAAAVRIQAFARGLGVRRRLKAAVKAARYVESKRGGGGRLANDDDDDDYDFDQGADELLLGMKGVEDFLAAEEPEFMAAASAALASQKQQQQQQQQQQVQQQWIVAGTSSGFVPPAHSQPPQPQPFMQQHEQHPQQQQQQQQHVFGAQPLISHRPPALSVPVPGPYMAILSEAPPSAPPRQPAPENVLAWVEAHPGPASPSSTVASAAQRHGGQQQQQPWGGGSQAEGSVVAGSQVSPNAASQCSPDGGGANSAVKQQRYREKLESLMAEWGFKDMATAEIYYRRQRRQNQGQAQRSNAARMRDPGARFRRIQEVVEQRPQLRQEDVQRQGAKGPEVPLHQGSLHGPPSRNPSKKAAADPTCSNGSPSVGAPGASEGVRQSQNMLRVKAPVGASLSSASPRGGRQVSSADAALSLSPSPLFLSGGQLGASSIQSGPIARNGGLKSTAWTMQQQQQLRLMQQGGAQGAAGNRQPSLLPPLPSAQQQGVQYGGGSSADTMSDAHSTYSAAVSDGLLVAQHRRQVIYQQQQQQRGGRQVGQPTAAPGSSGSGGGSSGGGGGRLVLPAMPGAPSVNRWVLSSDGDAAAAGGGGGDGGPSDRRGIGMHQMEAAAGKALIKRPQLKPIVQQRG